MSDTLQRRSAVVTIYGGDYLDRIRHLEQRARALKDAEDGTPRTLDEVPEYLKVAEEHDALVTEAEASALNITLTALGRRQWREMVAKHPPRKDNEDDKAAGVNEETFREELVPASITDPEVSAETLGELSDADFDRLYITAYLLNRAPSSDPKASPSLVSQMTRRSGETSD